MKLPLLTVALWCVTIAGAQAQAAAPSVRRLQCEYRDNPLGVDVAQPQLGWVLESTRRGEVQTAYQILAASSPELLAREQADLWDSGQIKSAQTLNIAYAGKPLTSTESVFWKVRAWDRAGLPSAWSAPAMWTMGVVNPTDWQAKWIQPDPEPAGGSSPAKTLLRRDFSVKPGLRRAIACVCGLGYYELTLNGAKVSADLLTPGWTKYDKTCLYDTYDVTAALRAGQNAIGLFLGNGMYNVVGTNGRYTKFTGSFGPLKAIAQMRLEYQDGTVEYVVSDDQWRAGVGPVTFNSVYGGEDYDARLEQPGWDRPGFNASSWSPAAVTTGPGGALKGLSCAAPAIQAFDLFKPVKVVQIHSGVAVYDLGQNAAQMPEITAHGPAGSKIVLRPAELVNGDGTVDQTSTGGGGTYLTYTLAGNENEKWSPRFFYSGYRYLQAECTPAKPGGALPVLDALQSHAVHTTAPSIGEFSSSNELFNRIFTLVRWAQRSNMVSVLTDCPHREKLGWLEQIHLNGPALRYNFDLNAFFRKTMNDMADSQRGDGMVFTCAPKLTDFGGDFGDSPEWGSALPLVAWQQYEFTGDADLLKRYYPQIAHYVEYLGTRAHEGIVSHGLSDWYDIGPGEPGASKRTPKGVTATAFYYNDTLVTATAAKLLGLSDDVTKYNQLAEQIKTDFNQKFFHPDTQHYASGSQCAESLPLVLGMAPPEARAALLKSVVQDLDKNGLTAGDIGYRYLLRALAGGGRSDIIYAINNQSDKNGYGLQLARGATSLTEAWDANRKDSQDHFMLGQINEWFFHDLAGIQPDLNAPGFAHIIIKPAIVGDLTFARASYDSCRGKIISAWKRGAGLITLDVTIPANTTATVFLPGATFGPPTDGVRPVPGKETAFEVGSGSYRFTARAD